MPLEALPRQSFFLWGPRQVGKSTWLRQMYPAATWVDLLETDQLLELRTRPALLRERLYRLEPGSLVVIDEVQKAPELLDEVHGLIEKQRLVFALSGSSARKVRRGHANLLGGRALRLEMFGLVSAELGDAFDLERALNRGYLPRHYLADETDASAPGRLLRSYVQDYLKEEILAEALIRNLPAFSAFLAAAALSDGDMVNSANIARDCGVSAPSVREYFQILVDTLLGRWVPAFTKRPKRRVIQAPKFYFTDVGVVNHLSRRGRLEPGSELFGKAFENWLSHELHAYREYSGSELDIAYWRLPSGIEVDFLLTPAWVAIEAKAVAKATSEHLRGLRELAVDQRSVRRRILVCLEKRARRTDDGIEILPHAQFARALWRGEVA
ncbi:MAG: AAA family ATPase [Polyangiaceae bacterium]|nr:AAA family ATPase [Polyangiaceae bacterium]